MPPAGIVAGRPVGGAAAEDLVEDRVVHPDGLARPRERAGGDVGGVGRRAASRIVSRRCAYGRAWRGMKSPSPIRSVMTWTWPLQPGAGPDPDGRDVQPLGDRRGELLRDELEDHREGTGLLDRERVGDERPGLVAGLALDPDLADRVDRLRASARCGP